MAGIRLINRASRPSGGKDRLDVGPISFFPACQLGPASRMAWAREAARIHQDAGTLPVTGGNFTEVAASFVDSTGFLRDCQSLVVLAGAAQRIGQITASRSHWTQASRWRRRPDL